MRLLCALAAIVLGAAVPASALDRTLPPEIFGPTSADTLALRGPGSTGDISAMCVKLLPSSICIALADLIGLQPSVTAYGVDMTGRIDSTQTFTAALNSARNVVAPCGTIRITAPIYVTVPYPRFRGSGDCTTILYDAPAGSPALPALDIKATAVGGIWEDFRVDHQGLTKAFAPPTNGNPIVGSAIIVEADYSKVRGLTVLNGWDNCIALTALPPDGQGLAIAGRPTQVSVQTTRTKRCGPGTHMGGGLNVASSSFTSVDDHVDVESYGAFGTDIGAGANGNFSNITGIGTLYDGVIPTHTFYFGEAGSNYVNFTAINPGFRGLWVDRFAERSTITNMNIKAPGADGALIKAPRVTLTNLIVNSPGMNNLGGDAVIFDSSSTNLEDVLLVSPSIQGEFRQASRAFAAVGGNGIAVSIIGANTHGAISEGNLPPSSSLISGTSLGAGWTNYTPTIGCGNGTPVAGTIAAAYRIVGKTVDLQIDLPVTAGGGCTGPMTVTIPRPAARVAASFTGQASGISGVGVAAVAYVGDSYMQIKKTDGSTPAVTGERITIGGTYQAQ